MSGNQTVSPAASGSPPAVDPRVAFGILEIFATRTHPLFVLLLESTFFTALIVPILLCILYFSTPKSRRCFIWNTVLLVVLLGLFMGSYSMHIMSKPFVDPKNAISVLKESTILVAVWSLTPWIVDWVLLFRLVAVYPLRRGGLLTFIGILIFPITMKIARLCITTSFIIMYDREMQHANIMKSNLMIMLARVASRLPKVEWGLQMADNAYASAFFLWRLRVAFKGADQGRVTMGREDTFMGRVRRLFWIAASNFVIPVCFDIILLALPYPSVLAMYAQLANMYVNLIGVVFATVWSSSHSDPSLNASSPTAIDSHRSWPDLAGGHRLSPPASFRHEKKGSVCSDRSFVSSPTSVPLAVHIRTSRSESSDV